MNGLAVQHPAPANLRGPRQKIPASSILLWRASAHPRVLCGERPWENAVQRFHDSLGVRHGYAHRGTDLDDVVMRAFGAGEYAAVAQRLDDPRRFFRRRLEGCPITHELDPNEK